MRDKYDFSNAIKNPYSKNLNKQIKSIKEVIYGFKTDKN